jgi:hypothetical protein
LTGRIESNQSLRNPQLISTLNSHTQQRARALIHLTHGSPPIQREKTSQAFRDALHDQYKSSNAAKKKRRISEQAIKLHKQSSAPLLSTSAIQGSSEDIVVQQRELFPQARSYSHSNLNNLNNTMTEFTINPEWMRGVENPRDRMNFALGEHNMDLLLGGLDLNSSSHNHNRHHQQRRNADKRRMFASQKSATSVVECVQSSASNQQPPWINRSCPNLSSGEAPPPRPSYRPSPLMHDVIQESDEETPGNDIHCRLAFHDEWHHSTPDLYTAEPATAQREIVLSDQKTSLLLNRMMKKARSERVLMNTTISNRFHMFEPPQKSAGTTQAPINHEDLVLSPIGDGSTLDLIDKLQDIEEHFESFVNPLPY